MMQTAQQQLLLLDTPRSSQKQRKQQLQLPGHG